MSASGPDTARAGLDARLLGWMREPEWRDDEERFEALALELFAFQFRRCEPFRRFCQGRGRTPESVSGWREIPTVPAGAFKEVALRSFPAERSQHVFRTSGTAAERRGELHLDTLELYEASLLPSFRRHVLPDLGPGQRATLLVLTPPPEELPDSSLSHMFGALARSLGAPESAFFVEGGELRVAALLEALARAGDRAEPIALCGTAFAFAHLLEALAQRGERLDLPATTRIMETGGFKGRSRELSREALYARLERHLGVPPERVVNQYGMTELASQFYDSVLREPREPRRKLAPPWTRVLILEAAGEGPAADGEVGSIAVFDLANSGSVLALRTADLGRARADGFEVIGREAGAELRGCSAAADLMLGAAAP